MGWDYELHTNPLHLPYRFPLGTRRKLWTSSSGVVAEMIVLDATRGGPRLRILRKLKEVKPVPLPSSRALVVWKGDRSRER